jgi:hypothetical protein
VVDSRGTRHVVYRDAASHVMELSLDASGWSSKDVTAAAGALIADDAPVGYADEGTAARHLIHRTSDKQLQELAFDGAWTRGRLELARPRLDDIGRLIAPFFYEDQSEPHTFFVEPSLAERTVHDWTEYVVTTEQYTPIEAPPVFVPVPYFPQVPIPVDPNPYIIVNPRPRPGDWMLGTDVLIGVKKGVFGAGGGIGTSGSGPVVNQGTELGQSMPATVADRVLVDTTVVNLGRDLTNFGDLAVHGVRGPTRGVVR